MQNPVTIRAKALQIGRYACMCGMHVSDMDTVVMDFDARRTHFKSVFFDRIETAIFAVQAAVLCNEFSALLFC